MSVIYEKLINEIEVLLQLYMNNQRLMSNTTQVSNLHSSLELMVSLRRSRDVAVITNIITKVSTFYEIYFIYKIATNVILYHFIETLIANIK